MRVLGITLLVLIALFTGGCSLVSLVAFGGQSFILSGPGLLIALGCILWIKHLRTRPLASATSVEPPPEMPKPPEVSTTAGEDDRIR
ncbi:MAG: hypothetical protein ABI832_10410 [bacterium]